MRDHAFEWTRNALYWRDGRIPTGRRRDEGGVRAVSRWILLAIHRCAAQRIRLAKVINHVMEDG